jgi:tetratricopeptide (TPR) repeat protein
LRLAIAQAPPAASRVYEAGGARLDPGAIAELALAWAESDPAAGASAVETARDRGVRGPLTAAEWWLADEESRPTRLRRLDESIRAGSATESALRVRAWLRADEDPAAALADLERFLEQRPWSASGLRLRARLLMDLGRYEDAEEDLAALEAFDPANRNTDLLAIRARTREAAGDPRGAARALARTLEVYPEVESIEHLAALYRQAGDDGAEAVALRDAERAQRNTVLRLHRAARHRLWDGHQDAARELLDLLVQLDPDYQPGRRELTKLR